MQKKRIVLLVLLLLNAFTLNSFAYDPTVFVVGKSNLLQENENVRNFLEIRHEDDSYYVVPVYGFRDEVLGFIALPADKEEVVDKEITSRQLFKTADLIIEFTKTKNAVISNVTLSWFFGESRRAEKISDRLLQEKDDLTLIKVQMADPRIDEIISILQGELDEMAATMLLLSQEMSGATSFESELFSSPETRKENDFKKELNNVFDALFAIEDLTLQYESDVQALK